MKSWSVSELLVRVPRMRLLARGTALCSFRAGSLSPFGLGSGRVLVTSVSGDVEAGS